MPTIVTPSDDDEEIAALEADEDDEVTDVAGLPVSKVDRGAPRGLAVSEAPRGAFVQQAAGDAFAMGWDDEADSLAQDAWPSASGADTLAPRATPLPAGRRAARPSVGGWAVAMIGVIGIFVGGTLTIVAGSLIVGALTGPTPAPPPVLVAAPVAVPVPAPVVVAEAPVEAPVVEEAPAEAAVVTASAPRPRAKAAKAAPAVVVAAPAPAPEVVAPPPPAPEAAPEPDDDDKKGLFRRKKDR